MQAEADIANKSVDVLLKELELLFESSLETRQESLNGSAGAGDASGDRGNAAAAHMDTNGSANIDDTAAEGMASNLENVLVVETTKDQEDTSKAAPVNMVESSNDVIANPAQDAEQVKPSTITNSDTPPDTNGYISAPEHIQPSPPTPPLSNGGTIPDTQNTLGAGGIPWYLEGFNPEGSIVTEERWSGRDIVRSMSEELSEIDDEELKGLMGPDAMDLDVDVSLDIVTQSTPAAPKTTKKGKKKKAWRGFK